MASTTCTPAEINRLIAGPTLADREAAYRTAVMRANAREAENRMRDLRAIRRARAARFALVRDRSRWGRAA